MSNNILLQIIDKKYTYNSLLVAKNIIHIYVILSLYNVPKSLSAILLPLLLCLSASSSSLLSFLSLLGWPVVMGLLGRHHGQVRRVQVDPAGEPLVRQLHLVVPARLAQVLGGQAELLVLHVAKADLEMHSHRVLDHLPVYNNTFTIFFIVPSCSFRLLD